MSDLMTYKMNALDASPVILVNGINQIAVEEKKAQEEQQDGPSLPEVRVCDYLMSHRASQAEVAAGNIIFVKFKIKYSISPI